MLTSRLLRLRIVPYSLVLALACAGCNQQPQSVAVVVHNAEVTTPATPELPPAAPASENSADLGSRALLNATAPDRPALPPIERLSSVPVARVPSAGVLNPDISPKPKPTLPAIALSPPAEPRPVDPVELIPRDLGRTTSRSPARPQLPVAKIVTDRARDVKLPPSLPMLGRPVSTRVSLDDPTSDLANASIIEAVTKVPLSPAAFLKVGIPDPFELGEQVKPNLAASAEPGLAPVSVSPRRLK